MDKVIETIAALGVPGLVLVVAMSATGFAGAAAITTALAALGPGGILGGIVLLGAIGLVSTAIAKYGSQAIFEGVLKKLMEDGMSKADIIETIDSYPISKELKLKLKEYMSSEGDTSNAHTAHMDRLIRATDEKIARMRESNTTTLDPLDEAIVHHNEVVNAIRDDLNAHLEQPGSVFYMSTEFKVSDLADHFGRFNDPKHIDMFIRGETRTKVLEMAELRKEQLAV